MVRTLPDRSYIKVLVGSELHKCFHEAGHIEVAYLFGATVTKAQIDADGNGRTSIVHKEDRSTKSPIACGGFAVEQLLFESASLVDALGMPLSVAAFKKQAMDNARMDKYPFYLKKPVDASGLYPDSPFQPRPDNTWPPESDDLFITYAVTEIVPKLRSRMLLIEALAKELCQHGPITQSDIEALRADMEPILKCR